MEHHKKNSPLKRVAGFIVDKRKGFYLIYILLIIFSIFSAGWVSVNNDITDYLSEETETRKGLTLMNDEFITYATAQVMVDNISYADAERMCEEIEGMDGVKSVEFDDTTKHYVNASALYSVTFDGTADDEISEKTLNAIEERQNSETQRRTELQRK